MPRPSHRKIKKQSLEILSWPDKNQASERLERIPARQLTGPLFAHLYHMQPLIKFRAGVCLGDLCVRLTRTRLEQGRIVLRRILWNLNDESGGIGWGSPEAMGEILARNPALALEFSSILFSYLAPGGTYIEHPVLQQGVIFGIGTYLSQAPDSLTAETRELLLKTLESADPIKQAYGLRALKNAGDPPPPSALFQISEQALALPVFDGWHLVRPEQG